MNIDIKESLLRFLVPPSLFWAVYFLNSKYSHNHHQLDNLPFNENIFIYSLIFVATGFVISAISTFFIRILDYYREAPWCEAKGELSYWKKISSANKNNEYIQKKIEYKWSFAFINFGSGLSMLVIVLLDFFSRPA